MTTDNDGNRRDDTASRMDQVSHEARSERHHIRVSPDFEVVMPQGEHARGIDLSLGGMAMRGDQRHAPGDWIQAELRIQEAGREFIVPFSAVCRHKTEAHQGEAPLTGWEFTSIEPQHLALVKDIVRARLSGRHLDPQSMVGSENAQTPRKRKGGAGAGASHKGGGGRRWGRYLLLVAGIAALGLVLTAALYRNFMLIEPSFAAVSAPRIEVRAPGPGVLMEHGLRAGDRVERDEKLTSVRNHELQSGLILTQAAQEYNDQLIDNLEQSLEAAGSGPVSVANSSKPAGRSSVSYDTVSPAVARARIDQFETAREYQSSRLAALEAEQAQNEIFSPCNCLVAWALSSADGTYIDQGERIMTLVRTGDDEIMVEALVHMSDIERIEPNQKAFISLPHESGMIDARVRSVALDVEREPRAGFPGWVRQQKNVASVLLIPEQPLPASSVGTPVDVRFNETPIIGETVERVWQGGRTVFNEAQDLYEQVEESVRENV
ncbi:MULTISPECIES: HlyD family efflux transporter periplasmic adaptor subunit [unclassified Halomonas]|uniref:Alginate biosynthesis protein Alg44 n=1 Tax=Halomonas sp. RT37 TaxID=2950872 RepID=A0AAU7KNB7_9GAMM|nr:HlyD family efflux transporter periplasmic adaptor subunit [Halomonas sp.]MBR9771995.1 alginate biosynthesis protein Alg44 [Gammaproteobacteria bacterium]MCJ8286287.1 alginate biosynthesis protein Alg44 [Halomonas sp.]NQY72671.1 alginate biosynthesis protein Alg44 [Halomonas sp.]